MTDGIDGRGEHPRTGLGECGGLRRRLVLMTTTSCARDAAHKPGTAPASSNTTIPAT